MGLGKLRGSGGATFSAYPKWGVGAGLLYRQAFFLISN